MTHTIEELERLFDIWQMGNDEAAVDASNDVMEALPGLLEKVKRLEADLQVIAFGWRYVAEPDNSFTKSDWTRDQLIEYARAALKETGKLAVAASTQDASARRQKAVTSRYRGSRSPNRNDSGQVGR